MRLNRLLAAAVLAPLIFAASGCSVEPPPPVSDKVAEYYSNPPTRTAETLPVMAILGDSFASPLPDDWPSRTARCAGHSLALSGVRSSGFYSTGIQVNFGHPDRMNEVTKDKPRIVIFETAYNDARKAETDPAAVENAIVTAIERYKTVVPDAHFVIVGPFTTERFVNNSLDTTNNRAVIISAAAKTGATHIEPIGWQPSTDYTDADLTHPNDRGHRYIAAQLVKALHEKGMIEFTGGCEYAE